MGLGKKIRIFVIDDSPLFRTFIINGLSKLPYIEIVGEAADPVEASQKIVKCRPDVITCDIEMPKMNGIQFTKQLMEKYPLPLIIVSSVSHAAVDALKAGAVDFLVKEEFHSVKEKEAFIQILAEKIKVVSRANLPTKKKIELRSDVKFIKQTQTKLIAIGASTGGTEAIFKLLKDLPPTVPGIVIVQHIPPGFSRMFAERLNKFTFFKAKEAVSGDTVEQGTILVARGDRQLKVVRKGTEYKVVCGSSEKVSGHCPSVDVLFHSVAKEVGSEAMGVILTGMGCDGAKGLLAMRNAGAKTIGQDEASSVVYGMPKEAFHIGAVEQQVSLQKMAQEICHRL